MSSVDDIVVQNITVSDKAPTRPSFGLPLICGFHTRWVDTHYRLYGDTDELITDGFTTDDYLYKAFQAMKSAEQAPPRIMVGRRDAALTQIVTLTPTATVAGTKYTGTIGTQSFTYTVLAGATVATIVTALVALIDPFTTVSAVDSTTTVTVTASTPANGPVAFDVSSNFLVKDNTADTTTDVMLAAIDSELDGQDDTFYGLIVCDSSSKATALLQAAYTEAKTKISLFQSSDSAVLDGASTTDTAYALKAAAYNRTGVVFHSKIGGTEWLAAGWMAGRLSQDPGAETWAFKSVPGVTFDKLKTAQKTAADGKNCSVYVKSHTVPITWEGKAASGRFLDSTRGIDWQSSTIDFDIFTKFFQTPRVPFDSKGLSSIGLVIEGSLQKGQIAGVVSDEPAPIVIAPALADTTVSDRALRIGRGYQYSYRLSGALHSVRVKGTITV